MAILVSIPPSPAHTSLSTNLIIAILGCCLSLKKAFQTCLLRQHYELLKTFTPILYIFLVPSIGIQVNNIQTTRKNSQFLL